MLTESTQRYQPQTSFVHDQYGMLKVYCYSLSCMVLWYICHKTFDDTKFFFRPFHMFVTILCAHFGSSPLQEDHGRSLMLQHGVQF